MNYLIVTNHPSVIHNVQWHILCHLIFFKSIFTLMHYVAVNIFLIFWLLWLTITVHGAPEKVRVILMRVVLYNVEHDDAVPLGGRVPHQFNLVLTYSVQGDILWGTGDYIENSLVLNTCIYPHILHHLKLIHIQVQHSMHTIVFTLKKTSDDFHEIKNLVSL